MHPIYGTTLRQIPQKQPECLHDLLTVLPIRDECISVRRVASLRWTRQRCVSDLIERRRPERLDIRATIFVEQDSQKGILIGKGGAMLKRIGTDARRELERFFGIQVFLGLTVDVRRNWRKDPQALREFGFRLTS